MIHVIRREISDVATDFNSTDMDLVKFIEVENIEDYNSVIDSLYLLEDTQLSKHTFSTFEFFNMDFGHLYLLFYGVLNACYMQQQAILVLSKKLQTNENKSIIKKATIFEYRNNFSAHSSNRGYGENEHSFILDRHAMYEGKVKGYSSNHKDGYIFKEAKISALINNWDCILESQLNIICKRILKNKT